MSNETQWTPGPWKFYDGLNTHSELTTEEAMEHGGDSVLYHGADWRMKEADKRLIAAAPEMAAMLERMTNAAERRLRELRALNSIDALQLTNDIADARALLAKIKKGA